jgi:hypothetical protein
MLKNPNAVIIVPGYNGQKACRYIGRLNNLYLLGSGFNGRPLSRYVTPIIFAFASPIFRPIVACCNGIRTILFNIDRERDLA